MRPSAPGEIEQIGRPGELDRHEERGHRRDDGREAAGSKKRLKHETRHEAEHDSDSRAHAVDGALRKHEEVVGARRSGKKQARTEEREPDGKGHDCILYMT